MTQAEIVPIAEPELFFATYLGYGHNRDGEKVVLYSVDGVDKRPLHGKELAWFKAVAGEEIGTRFYVKQSSTMVYLEYTPSSKMPTAEIKWPAADRRIEQFDKQCDLVVETFREGTVPRERKREYRDKLHSMFADMDLRIDKHCRKL